MKPKFKGKNWNILIVMVHIIMSCHKYDAFGWIDILWVMTQFNFDVFKKSAHISKIWMIYNHYYVKILNLYLLFLGYMLKSFFSISVENYNFTIMIYIHI